MQRKRKLLAYFVAAIHDLTSLMQSETTIQPSPKGSKKGVLILMFGGIAVFSLLVAYTQPTKEEMAASKVTLAKKEAKTRVAHEDSIRAAVKAQAENTVAARTLLTAYKADESRADLKYKGRNLYIEGKIDHVIVYRYNNLLTFTAREFGPSILCSIKDKDEVSHLKPGDYVAVYGMCDGAKTDIFIRDAHIVPTVAAWKTTVSPK